MDSRALFYLLMLRKNSETFMLSKAQREYFNHPSTHPAKNAGFAQDHFLCAASKQIIAQNNCLRNISYLFVKRAQSPPETNAPR